MENQARRDVSMTATCRVANSLRSRTVQAGALAWRNAVNRFMKSACVRAEK